MRRTILALALPLALLAPATRSSAESAAMVPSGYRQAPADPVHRAVGPAAELAHAAGDLWRSTLSSLHHHDEAERDLTRQVFALAGMSRLAAERLADHDATRE